MNYTEFRQRMRRAIWVVSKSPAAVASGKYGRNELRVFENGTLSQFMGIIADREKHRMAKGKGRKTGFVQNLKFVDIELSTEGRTQFKQWEWTDDDLISYVETRGNDGYKLGVSYKSERGAWVASLTCIAKEDPNFEFCLSAYGGNWLQAIRVLAYKDLVLLAGNWADSDKSVSDEDNFG